MRTRMAVLILACAAWPALAEKFHLNATPVVPSAMGDLNVDRDSNGNTRVEMHVEHLAHPADLAPPMEVYVVWFQAPGAQAENQGDLKVGGGLKADLRTVTPLRDFDVIVTAEHDPRTTAMTGPVVMRATVHQR